MSSTVPVGSIFSHVAVPLPFDSTANFLHIMLKYEQPFEHVLGHVDKHVSNSVCLRRLQPKCLEVPGWRPGTLNAQGVVKQ